MDRYVARDMNLKSDIRPQSFKWIPCENHDTADHVKTSAIFMLCYRYQIGKTIHKPFKGYVMEQWYGLHGSRCSFG